MQVNLPFDRMLFQPTEFVETWVPPVNLQNIPPGLQPLIPKATAMILNLAQQQATANFGRMLACNAIASNNFNNQFLAMVVDMTVRYAGFRAMGDNVPLNAIGYLPECVREMWTLFTSAIVVANPVVQSTLPSMSLAGAHQNNQQFYQLQSKLASANFSVYMAPQAQTYQQQPQYQPQQVPVSQMQSGSISPWAQPQPTQTQTPGLGQSGWFGNPNAAAPASSQWTQAPVQQPQQVPQQLQPEQPAAIPSHQVARAKPQTGMATETLTINKGDEMDINNHALPYFGSSVTLDLDTRREDFRSDAMVSIREGRRADSNIHDPKILDMATSAELNIQSAIFITRAAHASVKEPERACTIYRKFFDILDPVVIHPACEPLMTAVANLNSLQHLPQAFRKLIGDFKDPGNPSATELALLNFAAYIDRQLALFLNDFLMYNMREDSLAVSSYSADIDELRTWLKQHRPERAIQVLNAWENRMLTMIKEGYNDNAKAYLDGFFADGADQTFGFVPYKASVTVLTLTNLELGMDIGAKGAVVDPKVSPVIHDLVKGINSNKKDTEIPTQIDVVVTADNHVYRVAENAMNPGSFAIFRM